MTLFFLEKFIRHPFSYRLKQLKITFKKTISKFSLLLGTLLISSTTTAESYGCQSLFSGGSKYIGICNNIYPKGHKKRTQRARSLFNNLGIKNTKIASEIHIYVEWFSMDGKNEDGFFYYTNYKEPAYKYTRKAVYPNNNIKNILEIILDRKIINDDEYKKISIYIHDNIIRSAKALNIGNVNRFYIRRSNKEVVEVRKNQDKICPFNFDDPCEDWASNTEKYNECTITSREIDIHTIIKGIIEGLGLAIDCNLSPDND